jgi:PAS domain S-box-containing protein
MSDPSQTRTIELSRLVTRALGQLDTASFAILDPKGLVVQASPGLLSFLDAEGPSQVIGAEFSKFVPMEHHPVLKKRSDELKEGRPIKAEFEISGLKGRRLWVQCHSVSIQEARGKSKGEVMVLFDIDRRYSTALRFDRFFSSTAVGIYQMDKEGRFLSANPAFLRLISFGSLEELQTQSDEAHLYVDRKARRTLEKKILEMGEPAEAEFEIRKRDGTTIWLSEDIHPVFGPGGDFLYFEGLARDVTETRVAEADLELLHSTVANVEEGILILEKGTSLLGARILFANDTFGFMTGYDPTEIAGKAPEFLVGPQSDPASFKRLEEDVAQRKSYSGRLIIHRKDGTPVPVLLRILPSGEGEDGHWLAYYRDLSTQVEQQIELQQDRQLRSLGEMATGLAHEWNNLLSPILAELARVEDLCEGQQNVLAHLRGIRQAAEQAEELANQVLTVSRREPEKREPVSINAVIHQAAFLMEKAFDRRIRIVLDLSDNLPPITLSSSLLLQVILNLGFNARDTLMERLQTQTEAEWRPEITLESRPIELATPLGPRRSELDPIPCQRITVMDNGMGMSDKTRARLFEAYFTTKQNQRSVGLGTAMVWGVIQSLGGWIEVDTQVGTGSCFHVYLPALPLSTPRETTPRDRSGALEAAPEAPALTILLVDDYHLVAKTFSEMLRRQGHTLFVAHDGKEALELLDAERGKIDLLITDLNMPTISGLELIQKCKSVGFLGRKLVMTGFLTDEIQKELKDLGVDGILQKPFKPAELIARVRRLAAGMQPA